MQSCYPNQIHWLRIIHQYPWQDVPSGVSEGRVSLSPSAYTAHTIWKLLKENRHGLTPWGCVCRRIGWKETLTYQGRCETIKNNGLKEEEENRIHPWWDGHWGSGGVLTLISALKLRLFSWEGKRRSQRAMQDTFLPVTSYLQMVGPLWDFTQCDSNRCSGLYSTFLNSSPSRWGPQNPFHHLVGSVVFFLW